jgi:hypothetical protein
MPASIRAVSKPSHFFHHDKSANRQHFQAHQIDSADSGHTLTYRNQA